MEDRLKALWSETLDRAETDIQSDSDFFDMGGDSLDAIKLAGLANKSGVELHAQTIFSSPMFSDMLQQTKSSKGRNPPASEETRSQPGLNLKASLDVINICLGQCAISNYLLEDIYPCTPFQRETMRDVQEQGTWMFQSVFEIGPGAVKRAKNSFELLRQRNASLRTRIVQYGSDLYQVVTKDKLEWNETHEDLELFKVRDISNRMCYGDALCRFAIVHDGESKYIVWTKVAQDYIKPSAADPSTGPSYLRQIHQGPCL